MRRVMTIVALLVLAAVIALLGGHVIHSDLGVPNGTIRIDAFAAAGFLSVICALGFITR